MYFATPAWDLALFELVNQTARHPWLDTLMPLASSPWLMWGAALVLLALALRHNPKRQLACFLALALAVGLADAGTNVVKHSAQRVRPLNAMPGVNYVEDGQWRQRPPDFVRTKERGTSYPSAHAANAMAAAFMAAMLWPAVRPGIWVLPLVVGLSRLYLGKHYPTDVISGWLLGFFLAAALWLALGRTRWSRFLRPGLPDE